MIIKAIIIVGTINKTLNNRANAQEFATKWHRETDSSLRCSVMTSVRANTVEVVKIAKSEDRISYRSIYLLLIISKLLENYSYNISNPS